MRSCLQETVINYAPSIEKYINKLVLYNQCPPRRVKDTNMSEIENNWCVRSVTNVTPVFQIEIELWGADIITRTGNDVIFICARSVRSEEYMCKTEHTFFMKVTSNLCIKKNVVGIALIIEQMHLFFVLEDKER